MIYQMVLFQISLNELAKYSLIRSVKEASCSQISATTELLVQHYYCQSAAAASFKLCMLA